MWQPTPVFLAGRSHGQRSLGGYSPWARKSRTRLETKERHPWAVLIKTLHVGLGSPHIALGVHAPPRVPSQLDES